MEGGECNTIRRSVEEELLSAKRGNIRDLDWVSRSGLSLRDIDCDKVMEKKRCVVHWYCNSGGLDDFHSMRRNDEF